MWNTSCIWQIISKPYFMLPSFVFLLFILYLLGFYLLCLSFIDLPSYCNSPHSYLFSCYTLHSFLIVFLRLTSWLEYSSICPHFPLSSLSHWLILRSLFFCVLLRYSLLFPLSYTLTVGLDLTSFTGTNSCSLIIFLFVSSIIFALMLQCSFKITNVTILCCKFKSFYCPSSDLKYQLSSHCSFKEWW